MDRFIRVGSFFFQISLLVVLILLPAPFTTAQKKTTEPTPAQRRQQQAASSHQRHGKPTEAAKQRAKESGEEAEGEDNVKARMEWFYEGRRLPDGSLPAHLRMKAIERVEEMRREERTRGQLAPSDPGAPFPISTTTWTTIGPQPTSTAPSTVGNVAGRTSAIAVDPSDATGNTVYVGGAQGGVWKTTDGGANWAPLTDNMPTLAIGSIAVAPSNPQIVYVGTGELTNSGGSYYGAGILKSIDGGVNWTHIPGALTCPTCGAGQQPPSFQGPISSGFSPGGGARIGSLAVHPTDPNRILAGVLFFQATNGGISSGVYLSTDGGNNWVNVRPGAACNEVVFDRLTPNIAYAALGSDISPGDADSGIYRSIDSGATWAKLPGTGASVLPTTNVARVEMAMAPSTTGNTAVLYVGIQSGATDGLLGFFKSMDAGTNWTQLNATPDYCSAQCWYDHVIRVHPTDPNVVFAGGSAQQQYLTRTTDGGTTWAPAQTGLNGNRLHVDIQSMSIFPTAGATARIYVGNDGGVWSSDLPTSTTAPNWNNLNQNLGMLQFYPGHSIHPADLNTGFGGTQDNGTQKYTGALTWQELPVCGDGGWTAIAPSAPTTVFAACQNIDVNRSTNGGTNFTGIDAAIISERSAFIPPMVIDPNPLPLPAPFPAGSFHPLYFGTFRVWQTTNADSAIVSWSAISPDLTGGGGGTIRTIAVAPGNSNIVYVGTSDGRIQRTTNAGAGAGATWTNLTTAQLPPRLVTSIAVDPFDATGNTAYATFAGFSGTGAAFLDNLGHVFQTTNGGASWNDISGNLPNSPATDVVPDPDVAGTLYAATDVGVFVTSNGGVSWTTLMSGLPSMTVMALKIHRPTRALRAATHGRGMWDLQLSNFTPTFNASSISPNTAAVGSGAFTLTVNGVGFSATSVVQWNGSPRVPNISQTATQLQVSIPASDVAAGGFVQITVFDPAQAPNTTNALLFSVINPTPTLTLLTPSQHVADGTGFNLQLDGTNFTGTVGGAPITEVRWNGSPRTTNATLVSPTRITVDIPGSDTTTTSLVNVTVFNPTPGGGSSNARQFTVGTPPPNDDFANAITITTNPFTNSQNNAAATSPDAAGADPVAPCAFGSPGNFHSIWYKFTPTVTFVATVDTLGSSYDSVLSSWTGNTLGGLAAMACDDDSGVGVPGGGATSRLPPLQLNAGTQYYFMVSGFSDANAGPTVFNFSAPPFVTSANPATVTVTRGTPSAPITITATPTFGNFGNAITFACLGLPSQSTCGFNPTSVTPGGAAASTQLTINTTRPGMIYVPPSTRWPAPPVYLLWFALLAALLLALARMGGLVAGKRAHQWQMACYLLAIVILGAVSVACGGGGGGGPAPPPPNPGTPTGTFPITVRATSGATTADTTVTLTVQ